MVQTFKASSFVSFIIQMHFVLLCEFCLNKYPSVRLGKLRSIASILTHCVSFRCNLHILNPVENVDIFVPVGN